MNDPSAPTPSGDDIDAGSSDVDDQHGSAAPADANRSASSAEPVDVDSIDLDVIERDLNDVQMALERLNDGSYWTDEVTGEPIPDDVLAAHPTARTVSPTLA